MYTAFLINKISGSLNFSLKSVKNLSYQLNCQVIAKNKPDQVNHSILRKALRKENNRVNDK